MKKKTIVFSCLAALFLLSSFSGFATAGFIKAIKPTKVQGGDREKHIDVYPQGRAKHGNDRKTLYISLLSLSVSSALTAAPPFSRRKV